MVGVEQPVDELNDCRPGELQKPLEDKIEYLCGFPFGTSDSFDNPRRLSRLEKLYKTRLSLSNFLFMAAIAPIGSKRKFILKIFRQVELNSCKKRF
jgi:hypothetical protein